MSRYSDIAALASMRSAEFFEECRRAKTAASQIAGFVMKNFQIPEDNVSFVELDPVDLATINQVKNCGKRPEVVLGHDFYWYFGLRIHFEDPSNTAFEDLTLKIGIKPLAKGVNVKLEQEFSMETKEDLEHFADWLYKYLVEHYSKPSSERPRRPGFIE